MMIILIHKRHKEIIDQLLSVDQPMTGEQLAKKLGVSTRTIRSDVKALNEILTPYKVEIRSSRQLGYFLGDEVRDSDFLEVMLHQEDLFSVVPNTPEERILFIIFRLASAQDYVSMESLAAEIYVSKTTINYDIKKIIEMLKSFPQMELIVSPVRGLYLNGAESTKRILLSHLLQQEKLTDLGSLLRKFSYLLMTGNINKEILYIYDMIIGSLNEAGYFMTDSDVNLLTVDFLISCKRIQQGFYVEPMDKKIEISRIVGKCVKELERFFHIHIKHSERMYFEQSFKAKRVMKTENEDFEIEEEAKEISMELLEVVRHKYGYDFSDNLIFISNLNLHLNSMLHRIRRGQYQDNPLKEEVKKNYSLAFEMATAIIPILKDKLDVVMNESEVTFIALHIAVALEEKLEKLKVCILCGSGLSTAQLVKRRLLSSFGDQMDIVGHFPLYQLPRVANGEFGVVQLIVTTLPISAKYDIPIIHVSPLMTREDMDKLRQYLNKATYQLPLLEESKDSYGFFKPELFEQFQDQEYFECIAHLCHRLYQNGYVDNNEEFYASVLEREALYSTIMDCAVAIPHPMESVSKTSVVAIGALKTPIRYQGRKIKLIILFAVNTKERDILAALYGKVEELLDSPTCIDEAAKSTTFEQFMEVLDKL